jgi:hypothetical protein
MAFCTAYTLTPSREAAWVTVKSSFIPQFYPEKHAGAQLFG